MADRLKVQYAVFAMFLLVATLAARADELARPPSAKELVGVWIGFDSDELTLTRLDLRPDSTGFCARISPADTILHHQGVHVYRITKWSVTGWEIEVHMVPLSNAFPIGYVKGRAAIGSLNLTIGGPENGGWKEQLLLQSESRMAISNREAKEGIEAVDKH